MSDDIRDYDYELPAELIAREPPPRREDARMLVVDRAAGELVDSHVRDLPRWLKRGDRLVLNNTRVVPARLIGIRVGTGAKWEGLYLESAGAGGWRLFGKTRGRLLPGERIRLSPAVPSGNEEGPHAIPAACELELVEKDDEGIWTANLVPPWCDRDAFEVLELFGRVPLPPYMERDERPDDRNRYQTTFAAVPGSVAAPTAGLHLTPELLATCKTSGVGVDFVTLHVGAGTFRPVTAERLSEHVMHSEWCEVAPDVAERIRATRAAEGRVVAVGTTSVRTLETAARCAVARDGQLSAFRGGTNLFIRPPFEFQVVDALLTNFHLPKSTLLVLVSCLATPQLIHRAYSHAIASRYRFFSYGDAMLIV
jgi:S-adenosylmethionine:tRNA ribosyltransferase-isomerase